jgi:hypothetical protein
MSGILSLEGVCVYVCMYSTEHDSPKGRIYLLIWSQVIKPDQASLFFFSNSINNIVEPSISEYLQNNIASV